MCGSALADVHFAHSERKKKILKIKIKIKIINWVRRPVCGSALAAICDGMCQAVEAVDLKRGKKRGKKKGKKKRHTPLFAMAYAKRERKTTKEKKKKKTENKTKQRKRKRRKTH